MQCVLLQSKGYDSELLLTFGLLQPAGKQQATTHGRALHSRIEVNALAL